MRVLADAKNNPKIWKAEVSCTGKGINNSCVPRSPCGSLLEVNSSDIYHNIHRDYVGDCEFYYYFICPVCGNLTELTGKDLKDYLSNT